MKNMKPTRIIALSCLLFAVQVLLSVSPKAQTISRDVLKLEGTSRKAAQPAPVSTDASRLIGTWEGEVSDSADPITRIYYRDGTFKLLVWSGEIKGSWKYIPKNESVGTLVSYQGDDVFERGTIRWLNNNRFKYTVTFHQNEDFIGGQLIYARK